MAKKKDGAGAKGIGRWVPIGMKPAPAAWKSANAADEHVILLLDSASGEITLCGDTSGVRARLGRTGNAAPAAPPAAARKAPRRKS